MSRELFRLERAIRAAADRIRGAIPHGQAAIDVLRHLHPAKVWDPALEMALAS